MLTKNQAKQGLYQWQYGHKDFTSKLFDLISVADNQNLEGFKRGFPVHVEIFLEWITSKDADKLLDEWGKL